MFFSTWRSGPNSSLPFIPDWKHLAGRKIMTNDFTIMNKRAMVIKNNDYGSEGIFLLRSQNQKSCNLYSLSVARGPCRQKNRMMTSGNMERLKTQGGLN